MGRTARAALAAVASLALVSIAPVVTATSAPAAQSRDAATAFRVAARINRHEAVAGEDIVRVTGRVRPQAAGQRVVLQQRRDGTTRWVRTGKARIKSNGRFVLTDDPSRAGVRFYRVVKSAAGGVRAGRSRELQLDVWGWEPLTWRQPGASSGVSVVATTAFGTELYDASLVLQTPGRPGYVEYTLGNKCRSLRATYALTDDSATGATGSVWVSVDGVVALAEPFGTGIIDKDRYIDVTDAFRIRFDLVGSATPAGRSAVGTPEVLCLP